MEKFNDFYDDGLYLDEIKPVKGLSKDQTIFLYSIALVFTEHEEWNTFLLKDAGRILWDSFSGDEKKPEDSPSQRIIRNNINRRDAEVFSHENLDKLIDAGYVYICKGNNGFVKDAKRGVISRNGAVALSKANRELYKMIISEGRLLRPLSEGSENNDIWDGLKTNKVQKEEEDNMLYTDDEDFELPFDDDFEEIEDEDIEDEAEDDAEEVPDSILSMSPKAIFAEIDKTVYSQEQAKKDAALQLWCQIHGLRRNFLYIGPSGCGKTEIFRSLKKLYKYIWIYDASSITSEGWKGSKKFYSVFDDMKNAGFSQEEIEKSLIVFDEFDKLVTPTFDGKGKDVHAEIQGEFLSMVEGNVIDQGSIRVDTSKISFAFLGAFEELTMKKNTRRSIGFGEIEDIAEGSLSSDITAKDLEDITLEDIIKYGMKPEIAGRISNISRLRGFDKSDYEEILRHDRAGILSRIADEYGMSNIGLKDKEIDELSTEAEKSGLGIRYLNMTIRKLIDQKIYEDGAIPESL